MRLETDRHSADLILSVGERVNIWDRETGECYKVVAFIDGLRVVKDGD